ncbi:hypothetical protein EJ04DRAFT_109572 [Polyplosphaeria fusca]|uniref:Uncharacterized protein n=1 Tax=Polyplosphaeria fusca TaxID=682080 RepID=A0A9P4UWR3_9PLEO|nr:hypothetical protein EJ04DRAFT_109572 [Polyplosphaeria fusca]
MCMTPAGSRLAVLVDSAPASSGAWMIRSHSYYVTQSNMDRMTVPSSLCLSVLHLPLLCRIANYGPIAVLLETDALGIESLRALNEHGQARIGHHGQAFLGLELHMESEEREKVAPGADEMAQQKPKI